MKRWPILIYPLLICTLLLTACVSSKMMTVASTAGLLEEMAKASNRQSDLRVVREGTPAYLMLMDGMIEIAPDNAPLLLAACQGYCSFASFVEDRDQEYAKLLLERGRRYGLRSLEAIGFKEPRQRDINRYKEGLELLVETDVPYLFWAASCWANWIRLNLDSMEALAELPRVEGMMQRVLEMNEEFYYGGAHLFMGIWHASRPKMAGGNLRKAQAHFLRAFEVGGGKFLMAHVYYASYYARQTFDKELFISTLQKVLETPADILPDLTLLNTLAKNKAKELLSHVEEYFD